MGEVMEKKTLPTITKSWTISFEDRVRLLERLQCLQHIEQTTSEHCPLDYDDICKAVTLLHTLCNMFGYENKKENGVKSFYADLVLKEENEDG